MEKIINQFNYQPREYVGIKKAIFKLVDNQKKLSFTIVKYTHKILVNVIYHLELIDINGAIINKTSMTALHNVYLKQNDEIDVNDLALDEKTEFVRIIIDFLAFDDLQQIEKPQVFPIASSDFIERDLCRNIKYQTSPVLSVNNKAISAVDSPKNEQQNPKTDRLSKIMHIISIVLLFLFLLPLPLYTMIFGFGASAFILLEFILLIFIPLAILLIHIFIKNIKAKFILNVIFSSYVLIATIIVVLSFI